MSLINSMLSSVSILNYIIFLDTAMNQSYFLNENHVDQLIPHCLAAGSPSSSTSGCGWWPREKFLRPTSTKTIISSWKWLSSHNRCVTDQKHSVTDQIHRKDIHFSKIVFDYFFSFEKVAKDNIKLCRWSKCCKFAGFELAKVYSM